MEAVDTRTRQSGLHSLINRDQYYPPPRQSFDRPQTSGPNMSTVLLNSAHPTHPPPPYTLPLPPKNNVSGIASPPESHGQPSRRTSDDKEAQSHRQSLPSIEEVFARPAGYGAPPQPPPPPAQPYSYGYSQIPPPPAGRSYSSESTPYQPASKGPSYSRPSPPQPAQQQFTFSAAGSSQPDHQYSDRNRHGALPSIRTAVPQPSYASYEPARLEGEARHPMRGTAPDPYVQHRSQPEQYHGYPTAPSSGPPMGYPPQSPFTLNKVNGARPDEQADIVHGQPNPKGSFEKVLKRNLGNYDLEMALAEVLECSTQTAAIAKRLLDSVQRFQRTDSILQGVPTAQDNASMAEYQRRIEEAYQRIKYFMVEQQHILDDQASRSWPNGKGLEPSEDQWGNEDSGYSHGNDAKKRRGRAAPPGRCHSCNRAETPEWRRGPDGARTLCNACGLHYAKLTRRMGSQAQKAQNATSSSLRPKSVDEGSPKYE